VNILPLRAVGWDAQEITPIILLALEHRIRAKDCSLHRPSDIAVEFVQKRIRALEPTSLFHVAVYYDCCDGVLRRSWIEAIELGIPEAVESETRFPDLRLVVCKNDRVGR
jgi:hypothetical protein